MFRVWVGLRGAMSGFDQAVAHLQSNAESSSSYFVVEDGMKMIELLNPQKGDRVFDLGCGTGYFSKVFADLVGPQGKVIAVDCDVERLKVARKNNSASNLEYHEGHAEDFIGGEYDIVFAHYMLSFIEDKQLVFRNIARCLKEGGKFAMTNITTDVDVQLTPTKMFSPEYIEGMKKILFRIPGSEFKKIALDNGLEVLYENEFSRERVHPNVEDLMFYRVTHTNGKFNETHFNVAAMKEHYGEGELKITDTFIQLLFRAI